MSTIIFSKDVAYPVTAIVSLFWLNVFQTVKVGQARKRAKIPYPQLYAEKAEAAASKDATIFNCTQRAHQNTLEYLPTIITGTLVTSLRHPVLAAAACGIWAASRFVYTIGYSTGDAEKRNKFGSAFVSGAGWFTIVGASTWTAIELLRAL
ncbi:membrane-associated proteins in eicosanoid and glutathione metabolism [Fomitopsis serialis]|uniref:membrane-associated proteins in eicosanoid and glutathione metabolism n=1 Tax=Fomitopsis serialis TaxID=139415 RepID=UPI0020088041|nr:membrane-associated proteins in eicosanoid and glutathione metabolism [Neoantrodia serialis]KAH9937377.1 membrane-associated proteins in eicosanoid and glutathione metabolism [Neoantrodia serialis]